VITVSKDKDQPLEAVRSHFAQVLHEGAVRAIVVYVRIQWVVRRFNGKAAVQAKLKSLCKLIGGKPLLSVACLSAVTQQKCKSYQEGGLAKDSVWSGEAHVAHERIGLPVPGSAICRRALLFVMLHT
jgi:hypothetical protein